MHDHYDRIVKAYIARIINMYIRCTVRKKATMGLEALIEGRNKRRVFGLYDQRAVLRRRLDLTQVCRVT